jgi:gliding motility-associated-like protein
MPEPVKHIFCFLFFLLFFSSKSNELYAQGSCPLNIGFENGNFTNWDCYDGKISPTGVITTDFTQPIDGKHTMFKNISPQLKDKFGGFPVNCPNGSGYSIKLGNDEAGAEAQTISYTFTIPASENDYSIIYNYAVVLQNPTDHKSFEQPQFTSKVFDVSTNKYLECGSFQYIAAPNLPGFKESSLEPNIYYKDWAPVTIKLTGFAGKTIRLEFTVNDCAKAVHFGYAYLDVDENCSTPISGNTYCKGTGAVILKAPYGFKDYSWYDSNDKLVGTGNSLMLKPPPPDNTKFRLEIVPFPGQGCFDTLYTTLVASQDSLLLQTKDTIGGCVYPGADITHASVTAGSTPGLLYNYFTDSRETEFIATPFAITQAGTYYLKATSPSGCTETHPVVVAINPPPRITITNPTPVCSPGVMDFTAAAVTAGSDPGLIYSYWQDTLATIALTNPSVVSKAGKYFIKGINATGCTSVVPVSAFISNAPQVVLNDISSCGDWTLNTVTPTAGSDPTVQFSFWHDAATSNRLSPGDIITSSTVVYARATAAGGCSLVKPVRINIHRPPVFTVTDPPKTTRPATVDLFTTVPSGNNWTYSYWHDTAATKPLSNPNEVTLSGRYFIKATDAFSCETTQAVNVIIIDPPIIAPNAFSPNNDGVNDSWQIPLLSFYPDCTVEIFNRAGQSVYKSTGYSKPWDAMHNGKLLAIGTYYYIIKLSATKAPVSGSVTIVR